MLLFIIVCFFFISTYFFFLLLFFFAQFIINSIFFFFPGRGFGVLPLFTFFCYLYFYIFFLLVQYHPLLLLYPARFLSYGEVVGGGRGFGVLPPIYLKKFLLIFFCNRNSWYEIHRTAVEAGLIF